MSLIKSLIQRLLDSRTTPEEAGHSAMPSSAPTTISSPTSITSWGTITTFTAPDDGYVTFRGRSMVGSAAQIASLPLENNPTIITATQDNYQGMSCNLPVVKGKTIEVYGSNIENIVVSFNRLIGGGYSILLWRALSCLRALSNYLPRSSFRTNPNGSAIKLCQTIQPSGLFTHLKAHPVNTSHRLTGMSLFTPVAMNGRKSGMETEVSSSPQRVLPTSAFKCLSLKAPKLGMSFRTPRPTELKKRPLSLFQQSGRNALTGGALC